MDEDIDIETLKEEVKYFCEERNWDQFHDAKEIAIGISTESAELLEHFRFKSDQEVEEILEDESKRQEISDEVADIFYFLLRMAQLYDIDISEAFKRKMRKNKEKYPVEKAKDSNKKYKDL